MLGQFASGKPFAIVATGSYVGEGFDDDRLDALFMAGPVSWSGLVAQYVGRLHRRREGKNEMVVYDYVDVNVRMLDGMYRRRLKECAAQGYELRPAGDEADVRGEFVTPESYLERFELDVAKTLPGGFQLGSPQAPRGAARVLLGSDAQSSRIPWPPWHW